MGFKIFEILFAHENMKKPPSESCSQSSPIFFSVSPIGPKPAQIWISVSKKLFTSRLMQNDFACMYLDNLVSLLRGNEVEDMRQLLCCILWVLSTFPGWCNLFLSDLFLTDWDKKKLELSRLLLQLLFLFSLDIYYIT